MKKFALMSLITVALLATLPSLAATLKFRSGQILCAELSRKLPKLVGYDANRDGAFPEGAAFAVVTVKIDPGRSISRYDYSLLYLGETYSCFAIAPVHADFTMEKTCFSGTDAKVFSLFFVIDGSVLLGGKNLTPLTLKCNAVSGDDVEVPFFVRDTFTPAHVIPKSGCFKADDR